jgi:hypothetical protein
MSTEFAQAKTKTFRIAALCILLLAVVAVVAVIILSQSKPSLPFRLSDEYYGTSEMLTGLTAEEYEKLISEKRSFVVMVDKPVCITTPPMRERMANFPDNMQFKYYQFMWSEAKESSLREYVAFVPSVAVIRDGEVVSWLRADSDEDTEYFNSAEALQSWIAKYVAF